MESFKFVEKNKIAKLPKRPGVYLFKAGRQFLYIGKAVSLRDRVKQHEDLLNLVKQIGYIETESEIEALLLEAKLIKKYQPKHNVDWKDDKNYFYVGISKEEFPKVFITHQKNEPAEFIGPFVEGRALKQTLIMLRKAFPYYVKGKHPKGLCPWCHLQLCPGPNPNKKEYQKNIKNLMAVLEGKRKSVLKNLKSSMKTAALKRDYEQAASLRDQISALENIISHSVFTETEFTAERIEAYDIANIQGQEATGSMVTLVNGKPDKNLYRKFKIKTVEGPNDIAMLKEVLSRRLKHKEWAYPDIILIDGGKAQLNIAIKSKIENPEAKNVKIMAIAKKHNELFIEGRKNSVLLKFLSENLANTILRARDEAHRFARAYHHKLRDKALLG